METVFNIWRTNRGLYLRILEKYGLEQLNHIPEGFKNNMIWNIGHIIVAQQGLVYRLSNIPMNISMDMYEMYKNGSFPTGQTSQQEVDELKHLLIDLIDKTEADYKTNVFVEFHPYQTQTGFMLSTFQEMIQFNNYHEGLHLGIVMSLRKFVK